jgi:mRNA interferase MazF
MTYPRRGEIYWIDLEPIVGSELKKIRPCIIISPDAANQSGPLIIVAPISKAEGKKIYFHEIQLPPGTAALPQDSKIKVFQLRCLDKKRLRGGKIGVLPEDLLEKLNEKIKIVTGLY